MSKPEAETESTEPQELPALGERREESSLREGVAGGGVAGGGVAGGGVAGSAPFRPVSRLTLVGTADAPTEAPQAAIRELAGWLGYGLTELNQGPGGCEPQLVTVPEGGDGSGAPEACFVCPSGSAAGEPLDCERRWVDWALERSFQPVVLVGPAGVCAALLAGRRSRRLRVVVHSPEAQASPRLFALRCFAEVVRPGDGAPALPASQLPWLVDLQKPAASPEPRAARFRRSLAEAASRRPRAVASSGGEGALGSLGLELPPPLPNRSTQRPPSWLAVELDEVESWAAFDALEELDLTQFEVL